MISKNQIKFVRSLHQKKFRDAHGLFIIEGPKLVGELLKSDFEVKFLYALESWEGNASVPIERISAAELERISTLKQPNQVLAVVQQPKAGQHPLANDELVLVLDDVKDPGNLGTIIRTADWFGVKTIFCSKNSVEVFNPKVAQSTMGSLFRVKIVETNLSELLEKAKAQQLPVYGAVLGGQNLNEAHFDGKGLLVMGSESHGIRPELRTFLTEEVTIPALGAAESLNVAVATGIILAALRR